MPWSDVWPLDLLVGLDPAARPALQAASRLAPLQPGQLDPLPRGHVALLVSGQAYASHDREHPRFDRLLTPGEQVNLFPLRPSSGRIQDEDQVVLTALSACEVLSLPRARLEQLAFSSIQGLSARHRAGLDELIDRQHRHELIRQNADWPYDRLPDPLARATVARAPYQGSLSLTGFVLAGLPSSKLRIPGVLRQLGDRVLLTLERHRHVSNGLGDSFDYSQVRVCVPCHDPDGGQGLWVREAWCESFMALQISRELYGFPARMGRVVQPGGQSDKVYVVARGRLQAALDRGTLGAALGRASIQGLLGIPLSPSLGLYAVRRQPRFAVGGVWDALLRSELQLAAGTPGEWRERTGARLLGGAWAQGQLVAAFELTTQAVQAPSVVLRDRRPLLSRLLR
jgi:hypothetical protein